MISHLDPADAALRLGSALGNGLYQGVALTLLVALGLRVFHRASAATRFAVRFACLLTVAALPVAHLAYDAASRRDTLTRIAHSPTAATDRTLVDSHDSETHVTGPFGIEPDPIQSATAPLFPSDDPDGVVSSPLAAFESTDPLISPAERFTVTEEMDESEAPVSSELANPLAAIPAESTLTDTLRTRLEATLDRLRSLWGMAWNLTLPRSLALALVAIWITVAAARLAHLASQCMALLHAKQTASAPPESLRYAFTSLVQNLPIRRPVDIGVCPDLNSPMVVGFLRPYVLVPESLSTASHPDMERILRHELAHVRRGDDWSNLAQQIIKAVLFFHPGVLWLSRRLTVDREIACDDYVLNATRAPREYALFLTDFASRTRGRQWAAAPAAWSNPSQLKERIHMILDPHRNTSPRIAPARVGLLTLAALLIAATGLYGAPRLSLNAPITDAADLAATNTPAPETDAVVLASSDLTLDTTTSESDPLVATVEVRGGPDITDSDATPEKPKSRRKHASASASAQTITSGNGETVVIVRTPTSVSESADVAPSVRTPIAAAPEAPVPPASASPVPAQLPVPTPHPTPAPHVLTLHAPVPPSGDAPTAGLEERLKRLERTVEKLARQTSKPAPATGWEMGALTKSLEDVTKEVERAARDAERAGREAAQRGEKASREAHLRAERDAKLRAEKATQEKEKEIWGRSFSPDGKEILEAYKQSNDLLLEKSLEARRKNLARQRDVLRRQIDALQGHIGHLESQLDQLEEKFDELNEVNEDALRDEGPRKQMNRDVRTEIEFKDDKPKEKAKEKSKNKDKEKDPFQIPGAAPAPLPLPALKP